MSPDDIPILFRGSTRGLGKRELAGFLRRIAARREVTCLLTGDRELRRLNRRFRGKNEATDVLSFPTESGGELAISLDRAAEQAREHGHRLIDEVRILMLHGVLHLNGFDHDRDSGEMANAERRWRKRLSLPLGLIERSGPKPREIVRGDRLRNGRAALSGGRP